ncbi:N-6 DNA methylase [Brevundimonas sp. NPDC046655]|uniref:N-6 DNA methylase n=1 Tax=unclassified Brevundimonas TaxID=2622653 RepID=UPI00384B5CD4
MTGLTTAPQTSEALPGKGLIIAFDAFVEGALQTARGRLADQPAVTPSHPLLNGVPYSVFRREIDIDTRREIGAFFSSGDMAAALAKMISGRIKDDGLVLDPTCGIGDLLLARAADLPVADTLESTVAAWGKQLAGFDTRSDLIRLCKARLCLMARARGGFTDEIDPLAAFPLIIESDMMAQESDSLLARADAILFNPPFGKTTWARKLGWAAGEINAAAIFLDRLTAAIRPETPIAAVLPEVLRCGSRYERFRTTLTARGYDGSFKVEGRFDAWTDVDVFTTLLIRTNSPAALWRTDIADSGCTVDDFYEVRVGSVVPHRDPVTGPSRAYICAKTTPAWDADFKPETRRPYAGRVFAPPFVAIRRTSSPSDRFRAVATVVTGKDPVAVENHLLVALPRDGTLKACKALMRALRAERTNARLNDLMRCRHLTTGAIKTLPWIDAV